MRAIKVTFSKGNTLTTSINGTTDTIRKYYIGQPFSFGGRDFGEKEWTEFGKTVEFLDGLTLEQIKTAVDAGKTVHWENELYTVVKHGTEYSILCSRNDNNIGLTWQDGVTMNGKPEQFYISEK